MSYQRGSADGWLRAPEMRPAMKGCRGQFEGKLVAKSLYINVFVSKRLEVPGWDAKADNFG
jgi:hypothetical protein